MALKTNYKDDIFTGDYRKYRQINNSDGTISLSDVTQYSQTGDKFGASDINATNQAVNQLNSDLTANSKHFSAAYDNTNDQYGFNVGGTFYAIGGGNPLSTKCKVKSILLCNASSIVSLKENGTYAASGTKSNTTELASWAKANCDFLSNAAPEAPNGTYRIKFTVSKDGYYTGHSLGNTPTLLTAGATISTPSNWYFNGYTMYLAYLGVEVPS